MRSEPNIGKFDAPGWVSTPHGRFVYIVDGWHNEFHLRDHLGNTRVVLLEEEGDEYKTLQQNHYYPFGMLIPSLSSSNTLGALKDNRYLYNGKEFNDDFELNWYDYGARFYDAQIARWHSVDPLAEAYISWTPYQYVRNNPIRRIDPNGMNDRDANWREENEKEDERLKARDLAMSGIKNIQYNSPPGTSGGGGSRRKSHSQPNVETQSVASEDGTSSGEGNPGIPLTYNTYSQPGDQFWIEFNMAAGAFARNYRHLRKANTIGADKYFHCKANFEAASYGPGGLFFAERISNLREIWDQRIKGYPRWDSVSDQEANKWGRDQVGKVLDACKACEKYRPKGLPDKY